MRVHVRTDGGRSEGVPLTPETETLLRRAHQQTRKPLRVIVAEALADYAAKVRAGSPPADVPGQLALDGSPIPATSRDGAT